VVKTDSGRPPKEQVASFVQKKKKRNPVFELWIRTGSSSS
jgi:hypothetical protein